VPRQGRMGRWDDKRQVYVRVHGCRRVRRVMSGCRIIGEAGRRSKHAVERCNLL
jgi:hypothetical protein